VVFVEIWHASRVREVGPICESVKFERSYAMQAPASAKNAANDEGGLFGSGKHFLHSARGWYRGMQRSWTHWVQRLTSLLAAHSPLIVRSWVSYRAIGVLPSLANRLPNRAKFTKGTPNMTEGIPPQVTPTVNLSKMTPTTLTS
jgi:hypothetical protein